MRRNILLLATFTSSTILLAALAVAKHLVSMTVASVAVVFVYVVLAGTLVWRNRKHEIADFRASERDQALKWLFVPFVIGAIGALVLTLQEGWNTGDTIGAIFFGIFTLLISYELIRRRRSRHS